MPRGAKPACASALEGQDLTLLCKSQYYWFCWGAKPRKMSHLGGQYPVHPCRYVPAVYIGEGTCFYFYTDLLVIRGLDASSSTFRVPSLNKSTHKDRGGSTLNTTSFLHETLAFRITRELRLCFSDHNHQVCKM